VLSFDNETNNFELKKMPDQKRSAHHDQNMRNRIFSHRQKHLKVGDYDSSMAQTMCTYSFAAYQVESDYPNIDGWNCSGCCPMLTNVQQATYFNNDNTNTFGYVAYDSSLSAVIMAFRGTVDLENWIQDLNFSTLSPFPGNPNVNVHAGFYSDFQSVSDQAFSLAQNYLSHYQTTTLYVTGHSLGAAMAQLAAITYKLDNPSITTNVYTFGCPRTGDPAFSSYYASTVDSSFRTSHWEDIVVHLPQKLLGFWHTPNEAFFDEAFDPQYTFCPDPENKNCADQFLFAASIDDHTHYFNMYCYYCTSK